jgi:hypothetical protein
MCGRRPIRLGGGASLLKDREVSCMTALSTAGNLPIIHHPSFRHLGREVNQMGFSKNKEDFDKAAAKRESERTPQEQALVTEGKNAGMQSVINLDHKANR